MATSLDNGIRQILGTEHPALSSLLSRYADEIELFNSAYGLVKVSTRDDLIVRHILDSLAPLPLLLAATTSLIFADVGSGAGLPGIPLAAAMPSAAWTLVERMGKRAAFLRNAAAVLGLSNVTVLEQQAETLPAAAFDVITCRAYSPVTPALLKTLRRPLKPAGTLALYKARCQTIDAELSALPPETTTAWSVTITPYKAPFLNEERHLVTLKPQT
jgi:16S rRNA (guanine527-N7)-methyltransferase